MALPGYSVLVTASTGQAVTFSTVQGIKSFKASDSRDLLDTTDFADGNIHARLAALRDIKLDLSGDYEPSDTGWQKIKACYDAGADVSINVYTSAVATTSGFNYVMQVASFDINASVEGKAEVSVSMMVNATASSVL